MAFKNPAIDTRDSPSPKTIVSLLKLICLRSYFCFYLDQYDLCALVNSKEIEKVKASLLQVLFKSFGLQAPIPPVYKKAPYVSLNRKLNSLFYVNL